jgi:DNA-binding LacI/PurR family transcriptional regulator
LKLDLSNERFYLTRPGNSTEGRKIRSASIHEIARQSEVSTASVSRALNGEPGVSEKTAKRIREVAKKLGYYPSSSARTLVTGRSRTFGLLVSDIVNPFFAELLREFEEEAVRQQYEVIVANINHDPRRIQQSARRLLERKVDGVAIMTAEQSPLSSELRKRQIPVVLLESGTPSTYVSTVRIQALHGMQEALRHLKSLGHRHIGYLGAPVTLAPGKLRLAAFLEAMKSCDLTATSSYISSGNQPTILGGLAGMAKLLQKRVRPTGVLVFNDAMALGALQAARRQQVSVPADLSIIGFDNIEFGAFVDPGLTTINCSRSELASFAFNTLREMSYGAAGATILLPTSLIIRSSTDQANR